MAWSAARHQHYICYLVFSYILYNCVIFTVSLLSINTIALDIGEHGSSNDGLGLACVWSIKNPEVRRINITKILASVLYIP